MNADLYAVIILLPLFATGVLLANWGGLPAKKTILNRILIVVGLMVLMTLLPGFWYYTDEPTPSGISGLGIFCLPLTVFFLKPIRLAVGSSLLIVLVLSGNKGLYQSALANKIVTDRPLKLLELNNRRAVMEVSFVVQDDLRAKVSTHTPCFVSELGDGALQSDLQIMENFWPAREYRLRRLWHTPLTGLSEIESRPARVWFTGGRLDQGPEAYRAIGYGEFNPGLWPKRSKVERF